jgi:intergrase/recombinase
VRWAVFDVPDRYIDAFQERVPKSVLARHYENLILSINIEGVV